MGCASQQHTGNRSGRCWGAGMGWSCSSTTCACPHLFVLPFSHAQGPWSPLLRLLCAEKMDTRMPNLKFNLLRAGAIAFFIN